ncbi:MAG: hypothetical protein K2P20_00355 [Oscillospiraceae bacterium]|nr:hypothetical protein [Oscillospiraceae bacterium]
MKTRLYSLPDWKAVLRDTGWADAPTRDDVERAVLRELTRGKTSFAGQAPDFPIEKGCRVTLRTESVLPKFNKERTVVTVGSGLYDPSVEAQLCGMTEGSQGRTMVRGEAVSFTVTKVEKKIFPALTDELVEGLQLEGVSTLAGYRRYMEDKMRREYAAGLARKMVEQLLAAAQMAPPAQEDVRRVIDLEYAPLRERFSLDTMSPNEWEEAFGKVELKGFFAQIYPDIALLFGTTGKESYYASREEAAADTIRACLVLRHILADEADPTEDPQAEHKLMEAMTDRLLKMIYGG